MLAWAEEPASPAEATSHARARSRQWPASPTPPPGIGRLQPRVKRIQRRDVGVAATSGSAELPPQRRLPARSMIEPARLDEPRTAAPHRQAAVRCRAVCPRQCSDAAGRGSLQNAPVSFEVAAVEPLHEIVRLHPREPGLVRALQDHHPPGPVVEHGPAASVAAGVRLDCHGCIGTRTARVGPSRRPSCRCAGRAPTGSRPSALR